MTGIQEKPLVVGQEVNHLSILYYLYYHSPIIYYRIIRWYFSFASSFEPTWLRQVKDSELQEVRSSLTGIQDPWEPLGALQSCGFLGVFSEFLGVFYGCLWSRWPNVWEDEMDEVNSQLKAYCLRLPLWRNFVKHRSAYLSVGFFFLFETPAKLSERI